MIDRQVSLIGSLEIVLLAIAISLDVFAVMTIEGSMLYRINNFDLIKVGVLFGSWQTVIVGLSNALTQRLVAFGGNVNQAAVQRILLIIAIVIFAFLGLFMIWKFSRKNSILEKRTERLNINKIFYLAIITSIDAFLVGLGLGALDVSVWEIFLPFIVFSILAVFAGIYVGHWFGFEQKPVAYYVSGTIFIVISIDLVFQLINT